MGHSCSLSKKTDMVRSVDAARHMEVSKSSLYHAAAALRDGGGRCLCNNTYIFLDVFSPAGSAHP